MEVVLVKASPQGAPITNLQLQQVVDTLNSRISNINFSAKEIVLHRDQLTKECIDISAPLLSQQQVEYRSKNHQCSAKSKAPGGKPAPEAKVKIGDLVFIKDERNKHQARDRYIISNIKDKNQKLTSEKFMSRQYTVPLNKIYPAVPTSRTSFNTAFEWNKHFSDNNSDDGSINADEGNRSNGYQDNALNARDTDDSAHNTSESDSESNDISNENVRPTQVCRPPEWARSGAYEIT